MKKITAIILAAAVLALTLCACGGENKTNENLKEIYIGVSEGSMPQMEIFYGIETRIPELGYKLVYKEFASAQEANDALVNGEIDFSCITQKNEFDSYGSEALCNLGPIYYYPYFIFLVSYKSEEDIKKGSSIAIPDDAEGMARALMLLDAEGFIELREGADLNATLDDIEINDSNFEFKAVAADSVASTDADIIVIGSQQAVDAGYKIPRQSIAYEKIDSLAAEQYSTVILANSAELETDEMKLIRKYLFTYRMYDAIDDCTDSIVAPSFEVE